MTTTSWKLIGLAYLMLLGAFGGQTILERRVESVRPLANQQAMENAELVGQYGDEKARQYFKTNHIRTLHNRVDYFNNVARPVISTLGYVSIGFAIIGAAGGFLPKKRVLIGDN